MLAWRPKHQNSLGWCDIEPNIIFIMYEILCFLSGSPMKGKGSLTERDGKRLPLITSRHLKFWVLIFACLVHVGWLLQSTAVVETLEETLTLENIHTRYLDYFCWRLNFSSMILLCLIPVECLWKVVTNWLHLHLLQIITTCEACL